MKYYIITLFVLIGLVIIILPLIISPASASPNSKQKCEAEGGAWIWGEGNGFTYEGMLQVKAKGYFGLCLPEKVIKK